ncbi:MAG TPA: histidine kinase [Verrucomicrobiae bacterium]|nr:histidine kinase [Verrucomicrobiae bacterium]
MSSTGQARYAARRLLTTRMALALGFGVLLTLLVLSGINAVDVISRLQSSNENILGEFLGRETKLDELRSAIYLSGTYVRDYLLEPDPGKAEQSREALADTRRQIQAMISLTAFEPDPAGRAMYDALRREIEEYWRTLDPVLGWNAQQRHQEGYRFLHDDVLPRRSSMLGIANTIASVNQQQLVERDHRLVEMFAGLRDKLMAAVAIMFLCGLALAFAAARHILRLEERTMAHLKEVSDARQELRNLSARLVETQENERKNISRDLHDAVGQSMSAVQFELHDLSVLLAPYPEPLRTRVDRIRELVESSVAMVRNMALLLRPSMLDDLGLAAALEWQANQVSVSTGVRIRIAAEGIPNDLPEEHKICVFRIVQEALNNVCRHARASSVDITVMASGSRISVMIRDDGRGFRTPRPQGLGLIGMQERAESLGGNLTIHSEPGQGTAIQVALPLPQHVTAGPPAESLV